MTLDQKGDPMTPTEPLRSICSWCSVLLHPGPEPTSHGVCADCANRLRRDHTWRGVSALGVVGLLLAVFLGLAACGIDGGTGPTVSTRTCTDRPSGSPLGSSCG